MTSLHRYSLLAALLLVIAPTAGCGDRRSDEQRLQDALANIEAQDYRAAAVDLKNVLRAQPDNLAARLALGEVSLMLGDVGSAEKEYTRARDLGATMDQIAVPMVRLLMQKNAHAEVLAEYDPASMSDTSGADIVRAYRAQAMLRMGSQADAEAAFDALLARDTVAEAKRLALMGKAAIARSSGDMVGAEALVRQSLDFAPDSVDSTLALGQILMQKGDFAEAADVLAWGRDNLPGSTIDHFMLSAGAVEALLGEGEYDEAKVRAAELLASNGKHPVAGFLMARAQLQTGEPAAAAEQLRRVLSSTPGYPAARLLLGATTLELGDFEQAELVLASLLSDSPDNETARQLLAEARLKLDRPEEAAATLRAGGAGNSGDPRLLNLLAQTESSQGNQREAIKLLEDSLAKEPGNLRTASALISAYVADGQNDKAVALIEQIPQEALAPQRREVMLLVASIPRDQVAGSVGRVDDLVARWPDDLAVMAVAGGLYLAGGQDAKARTLFERMHELAPDDRDVIDNIARLDDRSGNFSRSRALFEEYVKQHPADTNALLALSRIASRQGDRAAADTYLQRALEVQPEALMPNLMLVNRALSESDLETARRHASAALKGNPTAAEAHAAMGLTEMRASNPTEALGYLRKATELGPSNAQLHYYRGVAEVQMDMLAQARTSFTKALDLDGSEVRARRALLILESQAGNLDAAQTHLASLQSQDPDGVDTLEAEGDLRMAQGRSAEAVAAYEKAIAMRPTRRLVQRIFELRKGGKMPEPTQVIERWLAANPDDTGMRLVLAQEYQGTGKPDAAISQYEQVLKRAPDSALAMNNLAWLYLDRPGSDTRDRALDLAKRAFEAAPDSNQIADTYGWVLFKNGQFAEARETLTNALGSESPARQPDIAYHLAAVLQETGERDKARDLLSQALQAPTDFYSKADARALLDSL